MGLDLRGFPEFLAVAERGSFKGASESLGVTRSAVSQSVQQLEARLGVQLFVRNTRAVALTEAGHALLQGLAPAFAQVGATLEGLDDLRVRPRGTLRLLVSSIAEEFLRRRLLADFLALYPEIRLEIRIDDGTVSLIDTGFDAGVGLGEIIAPDMVAVSVSTAQRQLAVGAPSYFAKHGKPRHPRDLHRHTCISWSRFDGGRPYAWEFAENGREFEVALEAQVLTDEMQLMVQLACEGVGITFGMEETFRPFLAQGTLVPTLEAYSPHFPGFYLYYPSRTKPPRKLEVLVAFLRARMKKKSGKKR
jgi:DNA-binding transcriptional LysR family regulator